MIVELERPDDQVFGYCQNVTKDTDNEIASDISKSADENRGAE
jgi:hypothetical protein